MAAKKDVAPAAEPSAYEVLQDLEASRRAERDALQEAQRDRAAVAAAAQAGDVQAQAALAPLNTAVSELEARVRELDEQIAEARIPAAQELRAQLRARQPELVACQQAALEKERALLQAFVANFERLEVELIAAHAEEAALVGEINRLMPPVAHQPNRSQPPERTGVLGRILGRFAPAPDLEGPATTATVPAGRHGHLGTLDNPNIAPGHALVMRARARAEQLQVALDALKKRRPANG